jgi:hypothetical protein
MSNPDMEHVGGMLLCCLNSWLLRYGGPNKSGLLPGIIYLFSDLLLNSQLCTMVFTLNWDTR